MREKTIVTDSPTRALDSNGDSVAAPIVWSVADTTVTVDPSTGLVTGVAPGVGRVVASVGTLSSGVVTFNVLAPADTIIITDDSVITVTGDVLESDGLKVRLESFTPPGTLVGRPVVFTITSPDPAASTPTVGFADGLTADTVTTAADGTAEPTLKRLEGFVPPLTVTVTVSATRTRGAIVPGSGQHFTVTFE